MATLRISSTVLAQVKGTQRSFQVSMKMRIASVTCQAEVKEARRMACQVMMLLGVTWFEGA